MVLRDGLWRSTPSLPAQDGLPGKGELSADLAVARAATVLRGRDPAQRSFGRPVRWDPIPPPTPRLMAPVFVRATVIGAGHAILCPGEYVQCI